MNFIVKWGIKKYVLSIVNNAIKKYNDNIQTARQYLARYTAKVQSLLRFLNSLDAKLADGKLTEDEADVLCEEAKTLAEEMMV